MDQQNNVEPTQDDAPQEVSVQVREDADRAPAATAGDSQKPVQQPVSAGVFVLQWLSYAFWGWLILGLIWLVAIILVNAIIGEDVGGVVPYAMASVIVLLPIAFVTDLFYRRAESLKKTGAATVIMVIHAVIFALCGIGALVGAVFTGLSMAMATGEGDSNKTQLVVLLVLLFAAFIYAAMFLRTINPFKTAKLSAWYAIGVLAMSLVLLVFGVLGPVLTTMSLKDDRRIEQHLSGVSGAVNKYITDNKKLPDSLDTLDYAGEPEAKALVDDKLVTYKKVADTSTSAAVKERNYSLSGSIEHRYQLCVTYKQAKSASSYSNYDRSSEYSSYISTYRHPAGDVCYKLQKEVFDYAN